MKLSFKLPTGRDLYGLMGRLLPKVGVGLTSVGLVASFLWLSSADAGPMTGFGAKYYTAGSSSSSSGGGGNVPEAAYTTLRLFSPRGTGTVTSVSATASSSSTGLDANNRIYFAYPSLNYTIPVVTAGGSYPYTCTLSNEPSGMVCELYTSKNGMPLWRIRWPNPTSTAPDVVVRMTDSAANFVEGTWTIVVDPSGWYFVDAVNGHASAGNGGGGSAGTGTLANPWLTIDDVYDGAAANGRVYFRAGTYLVNSPTGGGGVQVTTDFNRVARPVVWLAYPGDTRPIIDQGYTGGGNTPSIRLTGGTAWVQGFETTRSHNMMFQIEANGLLRTGTFWDNIMHTHGPGANGENSAFVMLRDQGNGGVDPDVAVEFHFIDNELYDLVLGTGNCYVKMYSTADAVLEGNYVRDSDGQHPEGAFAFKADNIRYTFRVNKCTAGLPCVGGNQNTFHPAATMGYWFSSGEISYNYATGGGTYNSLTDVVIRMDRFDQYAPRAATYQYRNTLVGSVVYNEVSSVDTSFLVRHDVIINSHGGESPWAFISDINGDTSIDSSKLTTNGSIFDTADNLTAASPTGVIDGSGRLTGASAAYEGTRGHYIP